MSAFGGENNKMILLFINIFLVFFISIILHELGHYWYAKRLRNNVKIVFEDGELETRTDYFSNKEQQNKFIMSGVMLGLVPILIYSIFVSRIYIFLLLPYAYGCKYDLEVFRSLRK